jgi:hypothetical protein
VLGPMQPCWHRRAAQKPYFANDPSLHCNALLRSLRCTPSALRLPYEQPVQQPALQ